MPKCEAGSRYAPGSGRCSLSGRAGAGLDDVGDAEAGDRGGGFGRWFAIIVVVINLIGQFAWFPAYPLWSLIAILLSAAVLWALTAGWRDAQAELQP